MLQQAGLVAQGAGHGAEQGRALCTQRPTFPSSCAPNTDRSQAGWQTAAWGASQHRQPPPPSGVSACLRRVGVGGCSCKVHACHSCPHSRQLPEAQAWRLMHRIPQPCAVLQFVGVEASWHGSLAARLSVARRPLRAIHSFIRTVRPAVQGSLAHLLLLLALPMQK